MKSSRDSEHVTTSVVTCAKKKKKKTWSLLLITKFFDDFAQLAGNSANLAAARCQVIVNQFGKAVNTFHKGSRRVGGFANRFVHFARWVDCFAKLVHNHKPAQVL